MAWFDSCRVPIGSHYPDKVGRMFKIAMLGRNIAGSNPALNYEVSCSQNKTSLAAPDEETYKYTTIDLWSQLRGSLCCESWF